MNKQEKLIENTMLALHDKLNEEEGSVDNKKQKRINEDSERVEFTLGKEKRYIDPEKDKDLLDQLKAIKRKISHLEKYVSILSIDGSNVKVNFSCEGFAHFSYIVVEFDPDSFGSIKEAYISGSTYITEELVKLCNEINRLWE